MDQVDHDEVLDRIIETKMRRLLASYEQLHFGTADDIVYAYQIAVIMLPPSAVGVALDKFLCGKVDTHDKSILPTAPELAAEAQIIAWQQEAENFDLAASALQGGSIKGVGDATVFETMDSEHFCRFGGRDYWLKPMVSDERGAEIDAAVERALNPSNVVPLNASRADSPKGAA